MEREEEGCPRGLMVTHSAGLSPALRWDEAVQVTQHLLCPVLMAGAGCTSPGTALSLREPQAPEVLIGGC